LRAYLAELAVVFGEVWRVLRDDGTLWLEIGDSYVGSWGAQSRPNGNDKGSTLQGGSMLSARQILAHPKGTHTGSMKKTPGLKPKDLMGVPWRLAFMLQDAGWYLRSDIIWHRPNPMPESVTDRPTKSHSYVFLLTKKERYFYDAEAIREKDAGCPSGNRFLNRQGGARDSHVNGGVGSIAKFVPGTGRNARSVWTISTEPTPFAHFAVMPTALAARCIKAGCPKGGIVFDPFSGAGTTALVADRLGRHGIGLELSHPYCLLAKDRLTEETPLFAEVIEPRLPQQDGLFS